MRKTACTLQGFPEGVKIRENKESCLGCAGGSWLHKLAVDPATVVVSVPRVYAAMECMMIVAYAAFHLTSLIDIRHITFLCYPRTCSGECEPLDPQNFARGAKFEHCRAFEYQQRRVLNL